ncbi:MAG TPA: DEAD/DEAH box helicase [Acidimicrobiia bacterium]|nr:DEAD/DEAH box helicase [Acidimicrobiia bacterium]
MAITADDTTTDTDTIPAPTVTPTFSDLGVGRDLVELLEEQGITAPFPIQTMVIPDALEGRDVLGKAKTGSGKTLAFGLPLVERLRDARPKHPTALILVPTRELCSQVADAIEPFVEARGHTLVSVYGGVSLRAQVDLLAGGAEIVVATPGRLIDLVDRKAAVLDEVETVVIDEADEMSNMGFLPQVHRIMRAVGGNHRTMLFSATLDYQVKNIVHKYMTDPVSHEVESESVMVETSVHRFIEAHRLDKPDIVARIAARFDRTIVFTRTKRDADHVAKALRDSGVKAGAIHGDIPQDKRERALARFVDGDLPVLVATNVAARGLHVDGLDVVIHYEPPDDPRVYVHRSGRTARAGEDGLVVTLVEWDQHAMAKDIMLQAGLNEPIVKMFSNDERLDDLAGWVPPPPPEQPKKAPARRRRRRRL